MGSPSPLRVDPPSPLGSTRQEALAIRGQEGLEVGGRSPEPWPQCDEDQKEQGRGKEPGFLSFRPGFKSGLSPLQLVDDLGQAATLCTTVPPL